MYLKMG